MAWLSGITGKAESLLNRLDQTAASVLHEEEALQGNGGSGSDTQSSYQPAGDQGHSPFFSTQHKPTLSPSQSVPSKLHDLRPPGEFGGGTVVKPKPNTAEFGQTKKKTNTDEALFEFLNSPEPPTERKKSTPVSSTRHSRQSSTSSVVSNKGAKNSDGPGSSSTSGSSMVHVDMPGDRKLLRDSQALKTLLLKERAQVILTVEESPAQQIATNNSVSNPSTDSRDSPTETDIAADMAALEDALQEQTSSALSTSIHSNQDPQDSHTEALTTSGLDLENKLLRNEIASLNQEMASVIQRAKDSQSALTEMKERMDSQNRTASKADNQVRELRSREQDLMEAMAAKDSQLAILRVRLEEADRELSSSKRMVSGLQEERERILRDHTDSSGVHSQALDSLRLKLTEVEDTLHREQEAYRNAQQQAIERQTKLEEEQRSLSEALSGAERRFGEEKGKTTELSNQLKTAKNNLESVKQELSEYKEKATRILQSKERLIASLREGSGASGEAAGVSSLEFDTVKQERDMFKEEILQARMTIDNLRVEMADVEGHMQQEVDEAQDQIRSLEETGVEEKQRREDAEQELLKNKRELQYAIEEIHKQKTSFQSRLNDRETEIGRLRNQLATKSMSSTTENELESRVRELTESLIQKQTMVEALSTEKNSLGLQLERLGQQYRDMQASAVRTNTTVIPVHDDEDVVRQRVPGFMRETVTDTEMTRKMKRAANSIDKFSIRLGVFLRRYPIARVFVILYMALLHLWVMIVLLTYQPEMHSSSYQPQAP